jgi:hypothetical protein
MADAPRRPRALRLVAVLALFTFGCVTVRAPASAIPDAVPLLDGRAEPQLELWVEGNDQVPPAEVQAAAAEARAALDAALTTEAGGQVDPGEAWILVARAQGVTRTPARRHEQAAATVGLVVGAVVLIALVVVAVVASGKGSGGGGKGGAVRGAGAVGHGARPPGVSGGRLPAGAAGRVPTSSGGSGSVRPPAPLLRPPPPAYRPPPPRPHGRGTGRGSVDWGFQADLDLQLWGPQAWGPVEGPRPPGVEEGRLAWRELPGEATPDAGPEEDEAGAAFGPPQHLTLPPPPPLPVDSRGYLDGDALEVELTLVERSTGLAAWRKVASGEIDPRDRDAVRALVRPLLAAGGWQAIEAVPEPAAQPGVP